VPSPAEVESYVREQAALRGIPADVAAGVSRAESGFRADAAGDWWVPFIAYPAGTAVIARTPGGVIVPAGTAGAKPTSYGPFQLRAGKTITGDPQEAGMGDAAIAAGIDVTNPATWKEQVQFVLDTAAGNGTFAGTWSTAVGALAARFTASPQGVTPSGGVPSVGIDDPSKIGPGVAPLVSPDPISGFADTLGAVATAIAALPGTIAAPFVSAYNSAVELMTFLGQVNIYKRLGLIILGALLLLLGIVLFAVSFLPKNSIPIPV
jgi:hypothetical protein